MQKHKLCLECMNNQKEDYDAMKKQNQKLIVSILIILFDSNILF